MTMEMVQNKDSTNWASHAKFCQLLKTKDSEPEDPQIDEALSESTARVQVSLVIDGLPVKF